VTAVVLGCAYVMDLAVGDPEWFPHPVRAIGRLTLAGQSCAKPGHRSPAHDLFNGVVLTGAVVLLTVGTTVLLLSASARMHPYAAFATETLFAWTALATGSLLTEARRVLRTLDENDLPGARQQLSRIVGRDTDTLTESEVARAVIETLAESTCDGIVAPLCYLVVGGVPAALAYKAVNTLDSMIGHREAPYTYFGRFAARADDVVNFVPARLAAWAIIMAAALTGNDAACAARVWWRDRRRHDSPNAGHPEAAMAGALGVTLGGVNYYDGVASVKPSLGAGQAGATKEAARRACKVTLTASALACAVALLVLLVAKTAL
jgi:adenosylcobinamide-phosphate synthase